MKKDYEINIEIPQEIKCSLNGNLLESVKGNTKLVKKFVLNNLTMSVNGSKIIISCKSAGRKDVANANSYVAHIKNIFRGLNQKFVYEMEICNVHFPMTAKVEKNHVSIINFLGEKVARSAKILEDTEVKIEGNKITVSSVDVEKAGQTAANIEKATTVTNKDRRIFQDGIFITKKPEADL